MQFHSRHFRALVSRILKGPGRCSALAAGLNRVAFQNFTLPARSVNQFCSKCRSAISQTNYAVRLTAQKPAQTVAAIMQQLA